MDAMNMISMLSPCLFGVPLMQILHQNRVGHVDGRRQTPGRGLRQRDGCWDASGGGASGRLGPLPPRGQEVLRHRGQRHLPRYHPMQATREGQEGDDEGELAHPGGGHRSDGRPKLAMGGHLPHTAKSCVHGHDVWAAACMRLQGAVLGSATVVSLAVRAAGAAARAQRGATCQGAPSHS